MLLLYVMIVLLVFPLYLMEARRHTLTLLAYHKPQRKSEHPLHEMR